MESYAGEWKNSLFGCTGDPGVCCMGMFCGACLYGQTSDVMEPDGCMMPALKAALCGLCTVCMWAPARRDAMRNLWKLKHGGIAESSCVNWCCCPSCANCQEANELKANNCNSRKEW